LSIKRGGNLFLRYPPTETPPFVGKKRGEEPRELNRRREWVRKERGKREGSFRKVLLTDAGQSQLVLNPVELGKGGKALEIKGLVLYKGRKLVRGHLEFEGGGSRIGSPRGGGFEHDTCGKPRGKKKGAEKHYRGGDQSRKKTRKGKKGML